MLKRNYLRTVMDFLEKLFLPIQGVCIYASILTIFVTVAARELFKVSIVWGYEIASFFVIVLLFIGMPAALHHDANLRVTAIYDICPGAVKRVFRVIYFVLELAVLIMMAVGFQAYMSRLGHAVLAASKFPNWLYYGAIGIGVWLSLLELAAEVIDLFVKQDGPASADDSPTVESPPASEG